MTSQAFETNYDLIALHILVVRGNARVVCSIVCRTLQDRREQARQDLKGLEETVVCDHNGSNIFMGHNDCKGSADYVSGE